MQACFASLGDFLPLNSMYLEVYEKDLGAMRIIAHASEESSRPMDVLVAIPDDLRPMFESSMDRFQAHPDRRIAVINDPGDH